MPASPYLALFAGVCASSFAATLIRLCDAPPLAIAALRLSFAALILTPAVLIRSPREIRSWGLRDLLSLGGSSVFLAFHFAFWITSLSYTSVASSVLLVSTTPIFVAAASRLFLRERMTAWTLAGVAASVVGAGALALGDEGPGGDSLIGNALAAGGAVAMAGHLLIGRRVRQRMSALPYAAAVDLGGALVLLAACVFGEVALTGHPDPAYLYALLLAAFPQIVGHATFNWALRRISPSFVSVALLAEPILASWIAFLTLAEPVPNAAWVGGPLVMAGILMAARGERKIQPCM